MVGLCLSWPYSRLFTDRTVTRIVAWANRREPGETRDHPHVPGWPTHVLPERKIADAGFDLAALVGGDWIITLCWRSNHPSQREFSSWLVIVKNRGSTDYFRKERFRTLDSRKSNKMVSTFYVMLKLCPRFFHGEKEISKMMMKQPEINVFFSFENSWPFLPVT